MPLPSFTVTGNIYDILGATVGSELIGSPPAGATVLFESNIPRNDVVTFDGDVYRVPPTPGVITAEGSILHDGQPILLLANDSGLNVEELQWTVTVRQSPGRGGRKVISFTFDAPEDGETINLADVVPVPNAPVVGVGGGGSSVTWSNIPGKPAVVAAGVDQAAARTAIGAGTGNGSYSKPGSGIPASDLAGAVQTSLGKADTAVQSLSGYATNASVASTISTAIGALTPVVVLANEAAWTALDPKVAGTVYVWPA